ncbi:MAG: SLBB domain-containing protein, partial [SAR202 cluster bacterium]|nr:SLBB domain-containing protein [SAR202 cluster bacterium]
MASTPTDKIRDLNRSAQEHYDIDRSKKTRVLVQHGHCSQSVGAADIEAKLAVSLPPNAYLAKAGCDGACFAGTQVVVTPANGIATRHKRVTQKTTEILLKNLSVGPDRDDAHRAYMSTQQRIAMAGCGEMDSMSIDEYFRAGGYLGAARALEMTPQQVIEQVKSAGLLGRGGAYFPAALKWESAQQIDSPMRHLIVNSEEGEPGIFKDRHLMEGLPHRIIEGAIIAAYASCANTAHIYINAEANLSTERIAKAIKDATKFGMLGKNIMGSGFDLDLEILRGAGGYVCGEETTLLNTMEGTRREPRLKPPFPTQAGLYGRPTVINNPETLSSLYFIMTQGSDAFSSIGQDNATGTKIISLSGSVCRPGVAEVAMGTTIREIIMGIGNGILEGHELTAISIGGPSSGIFPPNM